MKGEKEVAVEAKIESGGEVVPVDEETSSNVRLKERAGDTESSGS